MACRILRNNDGTVNQVLASNNQPSILYNKIRKKMNEEEALLSYAGTYTEPFQKIVDNLTDIDNTTNIYDENGEIRYQIYDYIMNPEKFIGKSNIDLIDTTEALEDNETTSNDTLFGIDINNQENLEFHINTLSVIGEFLEKVGVEQRLVPEFLSEVDGSVVEGAIAAANFLKGTVDIIDDLERRPKAWNKLPEEAAHFWYRLLDTNSPLKKALWEAHQTQQKAIKLKSSQYGNTYSEFDTLKEEAIGQIIAETIKRIETKNASTSDYSFFKKFLEWVNSVLDIFKNTKQDPFEVAAMKILSSDMSDLMTWEEYSKLNNIVNFADVLTNQSIAPIDYTIIEDLGHVQFPQRAANDFVFNGDTFTLKSTSDGYIYLKNNEEISREEYIENNTNRNLDIYAFISVTGKGSPEFNSKEELDRWILTNIPEHNIRQKAIIQEVKDNKIFFDRLLNKSFKKKSRFLPKTLKKYYYVADNTFLRSLPEWDMSKELFQLTKKLTDQEKEQIILTIGYTNIVPTLKVLPDILKKYKKNPIILSEAIKIDGAKKQELSILNGIKEMIKLENPNLKSMTSEEFVAEVHNWLQINYLLGFANENKYITYRVDQTFTNVSDRLTDEDVTNLTDEEIERLPFEERQRLATIVGLTKENPDVFHNKVSLRFNDMSHLKSGHFNLRDGGSPSAWGNLTYFYTGKNKWKDAVLLHEIQNDNIETLREFQTETKDLDTSLGEYLKNLNEDLIINIRNIETDGKQIIKTSGEAPKQHVLLNSHLASNIDYPLNTALRNLKELLNERIDLYNSNDEVSNRPEKAQEAIEKAYVHKRIFTSFTKRGGIKSILSKEDLEELEKIVAQLNKETVFEENEFTEPFELPLDLATKKQYFKTRTKYLNEKINNELRAMYGENAPIITLKVARKARTRTQVRNYSTLNDTLNESVNYLILFTELEINKQLSKNINESKKDYVFARNATVANEFNKKLVKITSEQYADLVDNYAFNKNLLDRLVDEQAQKDIKKVNTEMINVSGLTDEEILRDTVAEDNGLPFGTTLTYKKQEFYTSVSSLDKEDIVKEIRKRYDRNYNVSKEKEKYEFLKQSALNKKNELEEKYGELEEEVKQTLEIEMNYFTPLIHHLLQKHINQYGKDVPMYFSGYNITKLTQGNDRTALIYAGKDEVSIVDKGGFKFNDVEYFIYGNSQGLEYIKREENINKLLTKEEYEKVYQQASERRAKEIKFEAGKNIGLLSNDHVGIEVSKISEKDLDERIKELNKFKKENKRNLDMVINQIMSISNSKPIETGAIYNAMTQISGVKLIWQDKIEGLKNDPGGYLVDLSNYNYGAPILFGLDTSKTKESEVKKETIADNTLFQFDEVYDGIDENVAAEALNQIADRLSTNLDGVPYNSITEADAIELLSTTQDKYNGQPAFFYNGEVYFIKDKLTLENVFHEFGHPFIKAIKVENPVLFNKLYENLSQTEEGQKIIREVKRSSKDDENSDDFKEEVLVKALTTRAINNELKLQESSEFAKFMDKLMYAIKQLMRKVFGKIKIDKLDANTTLDELAKMLNNESFEISTESITNSEKAFFNTLKDSVKELKENADDVLIQSNIDKLFKLIGSGKQVMKDANKRYPGMAESISKEKLDLPFQEESLYISKYQTYTKTNEAPLDLITYRKHQIEGLVLSLESYNKSIEKINLEINRSKSDTDSIKTISKNFYFLKILQQTLQTFKELRQDMQDQNISVSSPIFILLNKASNNAENGIKAIYKYNEIALPGVLAPHLKGINDVLIRQFNDVIAEMHARGKSVESIAAKERERDSYIRDENTLAKVMCGETPEPAGLGLSTLLESAVSSPDELISSFALYVKEALIDVEINTTKNFNDFLADTRKLLKAAGLDDFKMISKLGKIITYKEELGYTDSKTGEFKTHKVHTFLNKFKGYELVLSRFKYDIDKAMEDGDLELAAEIEVEREEWRRKYMHDKWKPEVYKMYDSFKKTYVNDAGVTIEIGKMAKEKYNKIMDDINNGVKLIEDELERIEIQNRMKIDTLWVEYKKLFSKYDNDGILKTGEELAITETLLEYRAERKKYFEWESDEDPESMPILRFRKARSLFEAQLLTKYDKTDDEFRDKMQEWDDMNTRKVIDKSFYTDKALILKDIADLYNSISGTFGADSKIVEDTKKYWDLIIDQLYAYRDEENHPNGILVSKEKMAAIKEAQEKIQELQDSIKNGNGLSKAERREYNKLSDLSARGIELTEEDEKKLMQLEGMSSFSSIPKAIKDKLKEKYNELANLQSKKSTDYYQEVYNHQIDLHNTRLAAKGVAPIKHLDKFDVDDYGTDRGYVESMFKRDPEFKKWFMANHIEVERWDDDLKMNTMRFERLYLWNQIEPRDQKYKKMMNFLNDDGQRVWIWGMPSLAYYKQNIKPEFETEEIVGETVDNRGQPLPRLDVPNSPFINQEYFDLEKNNSGAFEILEKIKEYHLKFQEKAPENDRLWMQVPRYEKTSKELTETNKFLSDNTSTAKSAIKNFVNKFIPNAEDRDEGLTIEDKFKLTKLDYFDNDEQKIHISGKTLMDDDQVSLDVITSVLRHMHSIERANKLGEIEPISKALLELLNDPKNAPKDTTKASWYHWITQKVPVFANKKGENIRAKAIKGLVDRTLYNVQQTGFGSDAIVLQKLSKVMMQAASFGFFALDIPSGLKNRFGQQLQQAIELAAGTSYDGKSFLKGKMIASKAMMQITGSIYSKGQLPYYVQLVNAFDPSQGMAMDKLPEYITRSIYKDIASPTNILMSPRKFMEIEATLEYFFGVMEFTKVERTVNGVTTEIPYHEAFELVDDRLTLRDGIDEKWDIGGSEFKRKRIFIQEKQNILNGVYSKFDQPEGNRYLFYRMFMFLRKFFVTGMVNRFGFSGSIFAPRFRRNNATQSLEMGYWIQSARSLSKILITFGKHWHFLRPSEKGAVYKALTEIALLTILSALIPMLFGWDGDDDDKYEKLRKRQGGPLGSKDFQLGGWLANHLLYQTMSVASENMQYYKVGFYSDMFSNFNLANGPSLQTYGKILGDIVGMVSQDDAAYYSKDVGPYSWQKAESAKIFNHIGKAFALTGKTLDPSKAIQDFISAENIYK